MKYRLKKSVRQDLLILRNDIDRILEQDNFGFDFLPPAYFVPSIYRFVSRYLWCSSIYNMFKKSF